MGWELIFKYVFATVIAGMERFAFKGVASNLVTYLTDVMGMSNSSAAKYVNGWVGFTSMLPLIVATLADSYWDRYSTILASSVLYAAAIKASVSKMINGVNGLSNNGYTKVELELQEKPFCSEDRDHEPGFGENQEQSRNIFHQGMTMKKHRKQVQNPTSCTAECNYSIHNHSDAMLLQKGDVLIGRNMKVSAEDVPFSIFWLLPQYILLGISDIFTVVGMQEFFYSEVPVRMRTMGIALYTSVSAWGVS
ncbi:UNVERIFIED_CONTAM: protein NRT1/ PTR FAMILY 5.9 [Sesamum latifolium]|uniref:Protein NRT1/ PTR FAMILY 5.9 n=1 Tax=Sesamum latifolium TaxID=2727402 RepID=A0AAW2X9Z3_9LAMI